jgi:predicted transcriptional regulator
MRETEFSRFRLPDPYIKCQFKPLISSDRINDIKKSLYLSIRNQLDMDIQTEKLELIKWLAEIDDYRIKKQIKMLQRSTREDASSDLTDAEKSAIDKGLKSIQEGSVKSHDEVKNMTGEKFPDLFK